MSVTRDFLNSDKLTDYTGEILSIPNQWGLLDNMDLFEVENVRVHNITLERREGVTGVIKDRVRGTRSNFGKDENITTHTYQIPHFPLDDTIGTEDVQGVRRNDTADMEETLDNARAKKLRTLRQAHALTKEMILAKAIQGEIYAPENTVDTTDLYTDFGLTRNEVDFDLGTATTNVIEKIEEVIADTQDNIKDGSVITDIVAICSPEFFSALVAHEKVQEAYTYYQNSNQAGMAQVLRDRLGSGLNRVFYHGGITFIEYRGSYAGQRFIPAGDAYSVPLGTIDLFKIYHSPADHFDYVNTAGQEMYAFEYMDPKGRYLEIQTEQSTMALMRKPEVANRLYSST